MCDPQSAATPSVCPAGGAVALLPERRDHPLLLTVQYLEHTDTRLRGHF